MALPASLANARMSTGEASITALNSSPSSLPFDKACENCNITDAVSLAVAPPTTIALAKVLVI